MKKANLATIADGAAEELFTHELAKIAKNILDPNCAAITGRSITLKFDFKPDESRDEVRVTVTSVAKLAPTKGYTRTLHAGKQDGKPQLFTHDVKQVEMFTEEPGVTQIRQGAQA
jgi:hypothetical protein